MERAEEERVYDVLVIGSGAGGLATAITARKHGLSVIVIEKEPVFGGTTAFSGGVLWIPGNRHCKALNPGDTREAARHYMALETGNWFQPAAVDAFLDEGPRMLDWFEKETAVQFVPTLYPDYHPTVDGGVDVGRSVLAAPFDTSSLNENLKRLRPPLSTITFMGMMFNSSNADIKHFFNATKSLTSFLYVTKRLVAHAGEVVRHGRGVQVTSGNALAARLAKTCFDLGIPIVTDTPAKHLVKADGRVVGVEVGGPKPGRIMARRGVVLACGGYAHDLARRAEAYAHLRAGGEHFSPVPAGNTGDGIHLGEEAGGVFEAEFPQPAAWMPVSRVPGKGVFPHLLDRYKPGMIAVLADGRRFTNESNSYHDVGAAMIASGDAAAWLICDHRTIRKYGLGHAKPAPMPLWLWLRTGYLKKGRTLADLAKACGIDAKGLEETVSTFNRGAREGRDDAFHRGETAFNRYLADADHKPNPTVAPVEQGPFYAVRMEMGDLGTFDGLKTTVPGEVIDRQGAVIPGLFSVGNDRASIMGGNYPGAGITLGPAMTFGWITGRYLAGIAPVAGNEEKAA
ncbi:MULTISPECIES: FAD-dependent oxidoreductase [Alphaproteobacteria]|uniref:FAD-binding dehydrogenase n=2 Tax=Alphaproteobacteria TaxID=28211 RepID=A0A512HH83_9HYPH|nr:MULTISPECIES: FAD-dependent oxidoreductase [Alphaproteobacteria]GEO84807.1 FAD-binding dehydrogenase [Ciceribacter naphthalenivorans]GLR20572.1 FAD-binding dehydrogenase [Ciceribacter naphthalenivorans]GLT03428.1 FAD-binding dehydrogenase [Sphingomonas psychrolutea]